MDSIDWMVYVSCSTYNHASYIKDALDGICMQQTTFPFVCAVIDDASTDNEPVVLRKYLADHFDLEDKTKVLHDETNDYERFFAQHKVNKNCHIVVVLLKYNHYSIHKTKQPYISEWKSKSKYVAICEGDDYWIHPIKLQVQVEFMESHPGHSLCIHAFRKDIYNSDSIQSFEVHKYPHSLDIIPNKDVINGIGMFSATASMLYRVSAIEDYPEWAQKAPVGDRPLKFVLFAHGHIAYIDEVMSVYRVGVPGSWTMRVSRNRVEERKTREGFEQLLMDFDLWTAQKYHRLVKRAVFINKLHCLKRDIASCIIGFSSVNHCYL